MRHELTTKLPDGPVYLDTDPARLAQIVGNLLNNACKFTPARGRIELECARRGGFVDRQANGPVSHPRRRRQPRLCGEPGHAPGDARPRRPHRTRRRASRRGRGPVAARGRPARHRPACAERVRNRSPDPAGRAATGCCWWRSRVGDRTKRAAFPTRSGSTPTWSSRSPSTPSRICCRTWRPRALAAVSGNSPTRRGFTAATLATTATSLRDRPPLVGFAGASRCSSWWRLRISNGVERHKVRGRARRPTTRGAGSLGPTAGRARCRSGRPSGCR
jgi:hypothetical protein